MESQYTIEERNKIYSRALKRLKINDMSMCLSIYYMAGTIGRHDTIKDFIKIEFPELYLFNPLLPDQYVQWYENNNKGLDDRRNVLLFCIEMTKP